MTGGTTRPASNDATAFLFPWPRALLSPPTETHSYTKRRSGTEENDEE